MLQQLSTVSNSLSPQSQIGLIKGKIERIEASQKNVALQVILFIFTAGIGNIIQAIVLGSLKGQLKQLKRRVDLQNSMSQNHPPQSNKPLQTYARSAPTTSSNHRQTDFTQRPSSGGRVAGSNHQTDGVAGQKSFIPTSTVNWDLSNGRIIVKNMGSYECLPNICFNAFIRRHETNFILSPQHISGSMQAVDYIIQGARATGKLCKVACAIATNPGLPGGAVSHILHNINGGFSINGETIRHTDIGTKVPKGQEEACLFEEITRVLADFNQKTLKEKQDFVRKLHTRAQVFYNKHTDKQCGYSHRIIEGFINGTIQLDHFNQQDQLALKKLWFAATIKDRWGLVDQSRGSNSKDLFFGSYKIDPKQNDPSDSSRAFEFISTNGHYGFIFAASANASPGNTPTGSMARTYNDQAARDYNYYIETIFYALVGQLATAASEGYTDIVVCRLGCGINAGSYDKKELTANFERCLNRALNLSVKIADGSIVRLGCLFNSVMLAGVHSKQS